MSLPISAADFFALAKYCLELGERIQNLGDEHKHLKARAKVLSLAFGQLHQALLKFKNVPQEYRDIFSELRESCYLTLCQIEPTLDEFERLRAGNAVRRGARKLVMVMKNSANDLKQELRDQFVILSLMVLRLNQMHDSFVRQKGHAIVVGMIKELKSELSRSQIGPSRSRNMVLKADAIEQASAELVRLAPADLGANVRATFDDFISHHAWIENQVVLSPISTENAGWNGSYEPFHPHGPQALPHGGVIPLSAPAGRVFELSESSLDEFIAPSSSRQVRETQRSQPEREEHERRERGAMKQKAREEQRRKEREEQKRKEQEAKERKEREEIKRTKRQKVVKERPPTRRQARTTLAARNTTFARFIRAGGGCFAIFCLALLFGILFLWLRGEYLTTQLGLPPSISDYRGAVTHGMIDHGVDRVNAGLRSISTSFWDGFAALSRKIR